MIIDIILAVIFIATVIVGMKRGFVNSIFELIAIIAALYCAYRFSDSFSAWMYDKFLENRIIDAVQGSLPDVSGVSVIGDLKSGLKDMLLPVTQALNINFNEIFSSAGNISIMGMSADQVAQTVTENVIEPVASRVLYWVSFAILYFVFSFIFRLIVVFLGKLVSITPLKGMDGLLGGALGFVRGVVTVFVLGILMQVVVNLNILGSANNMEEGSSAAVFSEMVGHSKIVAVVNDHNPFNK